MAILIVPGVCRYTVEGTYAGIDVATILDFSIDTTGSTEDRAQAIEHMAGVILNVWHAHVLNWISNDYTALAVSWVDLDDVDGSTGSRNSTSTRTWPSAGAETNVTTPGNVALLITKEVSAGRSSRNGRMFLPGVTTTHIQAADPRRVDSAFATARQSDMDSLLGDMNQEETVVPSGPTYSSAMVVTHVTERDTPTPPATVGHPTAGVGRTVQSLSLETLLATQKRRQRP